MLSMNDLQEELRKLQQQLEQKEEQIADLRQQLQEADQKPAIDPHTLRYKNLFSIGYHIPGMVHNLSNPLTVISARAQLLQLKLPEEKNLNTIFMEARKIESVLNYAVIKSTQEQDTKPKTLNLKKLLETEIEFLMADAHFKHNIQKSCRIDEKLPGLAGIYCHFSRLFLSLIAFAVRSLQEAPEKKLGIVATSDDKNIEIRIGASGSVYTLAEVRGFFDEPHPNFYEEGSLEELLYSGLYEAGRIVRLYHGEISVESSQGQELQFCVKLPYRTG